MPAVQSARQGFAADAPPRGAQCGSLGTLPRGACPDLREINLFGCRQLEAEGAGPAGQRRGVREGSARAPAWRASAGRRMLFGLSGLAAHFLQPPCSPGRCGTHPLKPALAALEEMTAHAPALERLNVTGCAALSRLALPTNSALRELDASGCARLRVLACASPALTSLVARACPQLAVRRACAPVLGEPRAGVDGTCLSTVG